MGSVIVSYESHKDRVLHALFNGSIKVLLCWVKNAFSMSL